MVRFANWPGYIDIDPADPAFHPTLTEFTRRTGITVEYSEPIYSDQQFFGVIGVPLAMGESPGYDLVVLSDWMAGQLAGLGWAERITPGAVPNAASLLPALRDSPYAGLRGYSLPWQAGFTGIGYNRSATGRPVTSITDLLTAPDLHGRVSVVSDMRDLTGLMLLSQGGDPGAFSPVEFDLALTELEHAVKSGQIRAVTNNYRAALARGDIAACVAWAGDVLAVQRINPQVRFEMPVSGGMMWTDNMLIPAHAEHKEQAEQLMNYYYEPAVAAKVAAAQMFMCPVAGAEAAMRATDPGLVHQEYVFPSQELLSHVHHFARLTPVQNAVYTEKFNTALGI